MKCPVDSTLLAITERRGIEIDYCPQCRGVWLDRGELDKLIDRVADEMPEPPRPEYREPREREREYRPQHDPHYRKKKKSFLGEFFEFGD